MTSFKYAVAQIMMGTGCAQFLTAISAIVIARLYSVETFGIYSVFIAAVMILFPMMSWRYDQVVLMARSDEEACVSTSLSIIMILSMGALSYLVVFVSGDDLAPRIGLTGFSIYLLPLSAVVIAMASLYRYWTMRNSNFKTVSVGRISNVVARCSVQIGGGLAGASLYALLGGQVFGDVIESAILKKRSGAKAVGLKLSTDLQKMALCARTHWKQSLLNAPSSLLDVMAVQAPIFLLGYFFSPLVVGWYALGNRLLNLPISLLGQSVGEVYFQRASAHYGKYEYRKNIVKLAGTLFLSGIIPSVLLYFFSPSLFSFIFGEKWLTAGIYAGVLAPMFLARLCVSPLSPVLIVLKRQDLYVLMIVLQLAASVLPFVLVTGSDPLTVMKLFSFLNVIFYAIYFFVVYQQSGYHDRNLVNERERSGYVSTGTICCAERGVSEIS